MNSWKAIPENSDFSIYNLPFGIFSTSRRSARVGIAIGDDILDLGAMNAMGLMEDFDLGPEVFLTASLNRFIDLGKDLTRWVRIFIQNELTNETSSLREYPNLFIKQSNAIMHLPVEIPNYTIFYSDEGQHQPMNYPGTASSMIVSGTNFHRPLYPDIHHGGILYPCDKLDFQLEVAFIVGKNSSPGQKVPIMLAGEYIFGMILLNDWCARDIQSVENYGSPLLSSNFATSISPWVVTTESLEPFKVELKPEVPMASSLQVEEAYHYDIDLYASLFPKNGPETIISRSNTKYLRWNINQLITSHTLNGNYLATGDMLASGPVGKQGSLRDLTSNEKNPIRLNDGSIRNYLQDYDTLIFRGLAVKNGIRLGLGELKNQILPAVS